MLGRAAFRDRVEHLSANDLWLLEHMVTAFWHTFGISNGLRINPETDLKTIQYRKGPDGHVVRAEVIQARLAEYLRWLVSYQESWGSARFNQVYPAPQLLDELLHPHHPSREPIVRMIELLQLGVPLPPTGAVPGQAARQPEEAGPSREAEDDRAALVAWVCAQIGDVWEKGGPGAIEQAAHLGRVLARLQTAPFHWPDFLGFVSSGWKAAEACDPGSSPQHDFGSAGGAVYQRLRAQLVSIGRLP